MCIRDRDIGISVDGAVDIAREAADIILLEKSLIVLEAVSYTHLRRRLLLGGGRRAYQRDLQQPGRGDGGEYPQQRRDSWPG